MDALFDSQVSLLITDGGGYDVTYVSGHFNTTYNLLCWRSHHLTPDLVHETKWARMSG